MPYFDDLNHPRESYSDHYWLPHGCTPRTQERIQRAMKLLYRYKLEQETARLEKTLAPPQIDWIVGERYLAVRCYNCDSQFAFLAAASNTSRSRASVR